MSSKDRTCNGDALEPNGFKSEVLDSRLRTELWYDGGEGSSGANDRFITYKRRRRRRARSGSDSKPHEDGRASVDGGDSQTADQRRWGDIVLQNMYQSLSDDEGGMQGGIRDPLTFHSVMDCMENVKVLEASDEVGLKSVLETKKLANAVSNGTIVGALSNGSLNGSNHRTVTENCQHAFLNIVKSKKFTSLSKLLSENFQGMKVDRLFNFNLIHTRMKAGAYEHLPMLFLDDVQQGWKTIQEIGTEMTSIAKSLSEASQTLYNEQFSTEQADFNVKLEQAEACCMDDVCTCRHCGDKTVMGNCLVCDSCEEMFHVSCIEPSVESTPPKSWYCASCIATGNRSPHDNCVVCEKPNVHGTRSPLDQTSLLDEEMIYANEENLHCSTDDVQLLGEVENSGTCKICDSKVQNVKKSRICEHTFCASKYYHIRCLTNKQKKSYGPCWYCPSCLCRTCLTDKDDEKIVLCDCCDNAYHIYCMSPPRDSIPEGKWFCRKCDAGIQRIRKTRRVYGDIEKEQEVKSQDSNMAMDMLLNAAKTLNYEEKLAAICWNEVKD